MSKKQKKYPNWNSVHIAPCYFGKLLPQLNTEEDIKKTLVNMFLVGQIFTNQNKDENE